ncbi:MAG: GNAT family N-acetyltransferase [Pseudomonadota bacterium]
MIRDLPANQEVPDHVRDRDTARRLRGAFNAALRLSASYTAMLDVPRVADLSLMQDPAFARALIRCGQNPVVLPSGMIVLQRRLWGLALAMLPRAAPPADLTAQLRAAGLHRTPLLLSPETACPLPTRLCLRRPQRLLRLCLHAEPQAQRRALHGKWRNQLRRAEQSAILLRIERLPPDPDHAVLRAEAQQARIKGYTHWPATLTAAFAAEAPDQTHLFRVLHRGETVAHMLFLTHGRRATYHLGHTTPMGRQLHAHNFLLWRAMRHFAQSGHTEMELGPATPRAPGLDRFKTRSGARSVPTGGTWLYWRPLDDRRSTA